MHRRVRSIVAPALASAVAWTLALVGSTAAAQTTTTTTTATESVTASNQVDPLRFINGVLQTPRAQNVNPTGINYADCISNMQLQFSVALSGFKAGDFASMQIWATREGDCTASTTRGIAGIATCWPLGQGTPADFVSVSTTTETFNLRVQDIVGPQNDSPSPTTYSVQGAAACTTQPTYAGVPMTIWFLPLDSGGNYLGSGYSYPLTVDMVGPPAPIGVSALAGDTLLNVSWTPNIDADTAGYNLYIDPIPGAAVTADASFTQVCVEAGATVVDASTNPVDAASDDADDGATADDGASADAEISDATLPTTTTAGSLVCHTTRVTSSSTSCDTASTILASGITIDSGTVTTTVETDEAGDILDSSSTVLGNGGISTIPAANIVGLNSGFTVSSEGSGNYVIKNLTDNVHYHVVVAAVDGSGNPGPPSTPEACDFPAPVDDFWTQYRAGGGQAGGGFCALEAAGMPVGSTFAFAGAGLGLATLVRRRRRRR